MISERDIWRAAIALIRRYGSNAGIEAAERANEHMEGGDEQSGQTWVRVMQAIERLQASKPAPGETVQ
jgi:hypothetical protein